MGRSRSSGGSRSSRGSRGRSGNRRGGSGRRGGDTSGRKGSTYTDSRGKSWTVVSRSPSSGGGGSSGRSGGSSGSGSSSTPTRTSVTKTYYYNPQTKTYSTTKIAGQKGVTQSQAQSLSRARGGSSSELSDTSGLTSQQIRRASVLTEEAQKKEFGRVVKAQPKSVSTQQTSSMSLTPTGDTKARGFDYRESISGGIVPFVSAGDTTTTTPQPTQSSEAQSRAISQARDYFATGETTPYEGGRTLKSSDKILQAPKRDVFITTPLVRKTVNILDATAVGNYIRNIKSFSKTTKPYEDLKSTYDVVQSAPAVYKEAERRGTYDINISTKDAPLGFKLQKYSYEKGADISKAIKDTSKEDIVLAGSAVADTALITIPTTRILNVGGGVIRGSSIISKSPAVIRNTLGFGTYLAETYAARKIMHDVYGYGKTKLGRQYTFGINLLQAESFANVEGGARVSKLIGGKKGKAAVDIIKKYGWKKYAATRLFPGFIEGGIGYNVALDYAGGTQDLKPFGYDTGVTLGGKGFRGLFPGKTDDGRYRTGRIVDTVSFGTAGAATASLFAIGEYKSIVSGKGKNIVAALGYGLDPVEAPGDVYTALGGVSGRTSTITPSFTSTKVRGVSVTKAGVKTYDSSLADTKMVSLTKTKSKDFTQIRVEPLTQTKTNQIMKTGTKVKSYSDIKDFVKELSKTNNDVPAFSETDTTQETKEDIFDFTDTFAYNDVPAFSENFVQSYTFTPKLPIIIPPTLPGGGGGSGKWFGRKRGGRRTRYARSLYTYKGKKKPGMLTGLEVRPIF